MTDSTRSGVVALVGRPNVGKSTLLNALLGRELSIVTPKPQTTRNRILGIKTEADWQIVFVDTPGLHRGGRRAMNRYLNRTAARSLLDAAVIVVIVEAERWTEEDSDVCARALESGAPVVIAVNKIDRIRPRERLLPILERTAARGKFAAVVPISAKENENLDRLQAVLLELLPCAAPLYPPEQFTDRDERFRAAEVIREKLTRALRDELPYGIAVEIETYGEDEGVLHIGAIIWVERKGQKGIVIGSKGTRLRDVGRAARLTLKAERGGPVHLELWVKVNENWADNERALAALGYENQ